MPEVGDRWWIPGQDGLWHTIEIVAKPHPGLALIVTSDYSVARLVPAPTTPGYLGQGTWHRTAVVRSDMWMGPDGTCCFIGDLSVEKQTATLWWEDGREDTVPSASLPTMGLHPCGAPGWGVPFAQHPEEPRMGQIWRDPTGHLYEYLSTQQGRVEIREGFLKRPAFVAQRQSIPQRHFETFCYLPRQGVAYAHNRTTAYSGIRRLALYKAAQAWTPSDPLRVPPKLDTTPSRYDQMLDDFLCQQ